MAKKEKQRNDALAAETSSAAGGETTAGARRSSSAEPAPASAPAYKQDGIRDGIEAIVIAFVLAFMFKTFEAEAFVIPTGSMAPGLMGAHHDLYCENCGYRYQVNSHEFDERRALEHAGRLRSLNENLVAARKAGDRYRVQQFEAGIREENQNYANERTVRGTCPICRFTMDLEDPKANDSRGTAFSGDRLIVSKLPYEFGEPKRFDVAVFKYPHGPKEHYIKRIVGLPNENIRLFHGDVFTKAAGSNDPFAIARKPEKRLLAMAQIVHDNDYVVRPDGEPDPLLAAGWPARWHGGAWSDAAGVASFDRSTTSWKPEDQGRSFSIDAQDATGGNDWLRYRHIVPGTEAWQFYLKEKSLHSERDLQPRPELISDFYAYDTNLDKNEVLSKNVDLNRVIGLGAHWVGDLMLECELSVQKSDAQQGAVTLELVEGSMVDAQGARVPCRFQCRIDLASGQATLSVLGIPGNDWSQAPRTAETTIQGPGDYAVRFANVDDQLLLWVDGKRIEFNQPTTYEFPTTDPLRRNNRPTEADLAPVGIQVEHASVAVKHLKLNRDVYYIATNVAKADSPLLDGYRDGNIMTDRPSEATQREFMSNPALWTAFDDLFTAEFTTGPDDFLPLGDNSPQSSDGRLWRGSSFVPRRLLIGEALFIYWPHSWFFPLPNVRDMEFVE